MVLHNVAHHEESASSRLHGGKRVAGYGGSRSRQHVGREGGEGAKRLAP